LLGSLVTFVFYSSIVQPLPPFFLYCPRVGSELSSDLMLSNVVFGSQGLFPTFGPQGLIRTSCPQGLIVLWHCSLGIHHYGIGSVCGVVARARTRWIRVPPWAKGDLLMVCRFCAQAPTRHHVCSSLRPKGNPPTLSFLDPGPKATP
jgi:hypothetical protein